VFTHLQTEACDVAQLYSKHCVCVCVLGLLSCTNVGTNLSQELSKV